MIFRGQSIGPDIPGRRNGLRPRPVDPDNPGTMRREGKCGAAAAAYSAGGERSNYDLRTGQCGVDCWTIKSFEFLLL